MNARRRYSGGTLASILMGLAALVALIMALHVLFQLLRTNENNGIVETVAWLANTLAWSFDNLFVLQSGTLQLIVDYGVPAVVYLLVARLVAIPLRRIGH